MFNYLKLTKLSKPFNFLILLFSIFNILKLVNLCKFLID